MKKIAQVTATLLMVLFLSIGSVTRAQLGPQGEGDRPKAPCDPIIRVCPPVVTESNATNSTSSAIPQAGTVAPSGQMADSLFFDLLLLFIQLRLGL